MLQAILATLLVLAPATQPADDLRNDPRSTLQTMMTALAEQNAEKLLAACEVSAQSERPYVESVVRMLLAGRKLADAATQKFGPAGDALAKGPIAAIDAADVPRAEVSINNNTAELLMPGHTQPLRFVKVGDEWKFRVVDFAGSQRRDLQKQTALTEMFAAAMLEAADEIQQGRYASFADAEAAIRQKLNLVLMKSLSATQPATRPSN
jgi:hypothetical protein